MSEPDLMTLEQLGWAFWTALMTGAAMACLGLANVTNRFLNWKQARQGNEGDVALSDQTLQEGQKLLLTPLNQEANAAQEKGLPALLAEINRGTLLLEQRADPQSQDFARQVAGAWPPVGAEISVMVLEDEALYQFTTRVKDARQERPDAPTRLLRVSKPIWLARVQRRQHVRVAVPLPALLYPVRQKESAPPIHGTIRDLSGGGFCVEMTTPLSPHEIETLMQTLAPESVLRARLPLPVLPDPLLARVRSVERMVVRGGLGLRVSCVFLPMSAWEQEALVQHLFRVQREQMRGRRARPMRLND